ncbi:hypothetical protein OKA05_11380 [Luteolibacter arcticus]|uniref:F5/8 type C domain-containing protein n=1 Tax=Luteolibacter arcticus TaxID=1581411 RepID=A0ABT3GI27_9BACT|nr:discoidin domain-containing protein [Luteolibacter arcticus]MCW1923156.1 hypothetical protein [Luteolibacter arcticus]
MNTSTFALLTAYATVATLGFVSPAFSIPVTEQVATTDIKISASSIYASAATLVDHSGLDDQMRHDSNSGAATMWHTALVATESAPAGQIPACPAWLRFDFGKPQTVDGLELWNHNQAGYTNRGLREVRVYGTMDGSKWVLLADITLKQAGGTAEEAQVFPLKTGGKALTGVILAAKSNYGGNVYGLSEVQFTNTREVAADALPFPTDMAATVQPFYRHRPDGEAGREVRLGFTGTRLYGRAKLEVTVDGQTVETQDLPENVKGLGYYSLLLPKGVGVDKAAEVSVTLRQGAKVQSSKPFLVPAQRQWTVFVYPHSHVDIGYTNTHENVEIIHKRNVVNGIRIANATAKRPEGLRYKWNPEVIWPVERYLSTATAKQKEEVYTAIRQGRMVLDAGYVNVNTSVCADEEMFHLLHDARQLQKKTGATVDTFVQVDVPGVSWGLLPVLNQSGIKYAFCLFNGIDRTGLAPGLSHRPFWWVGPDGKSKVLFYQPGDYTPGFKAKGMGHYQSWMGVVNPDDIPQTIKTANPRANFLDGYLLGTLKALESWGDKYPYDLFAMSWAMADNTPLDEDLPEAVRMWNEEYAYPKLAISSAHDIMSAFDEKYGDQLPVVRGDYTEYWTDGLGTAAKFTGMNRVAKERLIQADTLASMLNPTKPAPRAEVEASWRNILLGSEHTWCYADPNHPYFQEAIWKVKKSYFQAAQDTSIALLKQSAEQVPAGPSVAVMNTLSWNRGGLVTLSAEASKAGDRVIDDAGAAVPSQRLSTGELAFLASNIPALGSKAYRVQSGQATPPPVPAALKGDSASNGVLTATLDPATGNIKSLLCAGNPHEFVNPAQDGGLNAFRQLPGGSADGKPDTEIKVSVKENGPLVVEWQVDSVAPGCKSVSRAVRLVAGQPWLECSNVVDKLAVAAKEGIHFGFAFAVPNREIRADIPWGVMRVDADQMPEANRNWIAFQRWLDVSNDQCGVTWASLDASTFEVGGMTANIIGAATGSPHWIRNLQPSSTIYSWALNNHWHTNFPLTQEGLIPFRYRVMPHATGYDAAVANRFGVEQAQPLVATPAQSNPVTKPVVALEGSPSITIAILKGSTDGKDTILRLRSVSEKDEIVRLVWPDRAPDSVRLCTLDEEPGEEVGTTVTVPGNGFVTLRVKW